MRCRSQNAENGTTLCLCGIDYCDVWNGLRLAWGFVMARKFGGKYSPDASSHDLKVDIEYRGPSVDPAGANQMSCSFPRLWLRQHPCTWPWDWGRQGAWLLRDGLRAEATFHDRRVAIPRKLFAAVLAGVGVALAAYRNDQNMIASLILAVITVALHLTCFGLDPMKDKGMEGIDAQTGSRPTRNRRGRGAFERHARRHFAPATSAHGNARGTVHPNGT